MKTTRQRGQMVVMFAGMLIPIIIVVGLAIDGSYAYAQRRQAQNASDLAAFAGAGQLARSAGGEATLRDCDVRKAIDRVLASNGSDAILSSTYGTPSGPRYIGYNASTGTNTDIGPVPYDAACSSTALQAAIGVKVAAQRSWNPFFLGVIGVSGWKATADSIARMGYTDTPPAGSVFPIGLDNENFDQTKLGHFILCPPGSTPVSQGVTCPVQTLDDSTHAGGQLGPGNFGWLKFGAQNNCTGYGLGMLTNAGCPNGNPSTFLQTEIDGNSYGCCSKPTGGVSTDANPIDRIGGGPGHNGQGGDDCSAVIGKTYLLPVYDQTGSNSANSFWYHIIGFAGFEITACDGGKNVTGVWRTPIVGGPTSQTIPPGPLKIIAVELVR